MKLPKVIFIDWNGTLSKSLFWEQLSDPSHKLHCKFPFIESVLFNKDNNLVVPWMKGEITSEDVCKFIAEKTGLEYDLLLQELELSCQSMKLLNSDVEDILKKIKDKGVKIVIATDNMDTFTKYTYDEINKDGLFDDYINSFELGCFKYDCVDNKLPFFEEYLNKNKLSYQDVVLIDDSVDKKGNYQRLGFTIINIGDSLTLEQALRRYV